MNPKIEKLARDVIALAEKQYEGAIMFEPFIPATGKLSPYEEIMQGLGCPERRQVKDKITELLCNGISNF